MISVCALCFSDWMLESSDDTGGGIDRLCLSEIQVLFVWPLWFFGSQVPQWLVLIEVVQIEAVVSAEVVQSVSSRVEVTVLEVLWCCCCQVRVGRSGEG